MSRSAEAAATARRRELERLRVEPLNRECVFEDGRRRPSTVIGRVYSCHHEKRTQATGLTPVRAAAESSDFVEKRARTPIPCTEVCASVFFRMSDPPSASRADDDLRTVLDRMSDGFFAVDADWQITYANERGTEILRSAMADGVVESAETIDGFHLWKSIPEATDTEFYHRYHEAMETQEQATFHSYYPPLKTWFEARVFPSDTGLSVYLRDVTERRELERQQRESRRAIQQLYAVSSDRDQSFEEKVETMLELSCEYLDLPNAFLTRIDDDTQHIELAHATHSALQPGESCPLEEAYCKRTIELDRLLTIVDPTDEGLTDDPAYERFGLGTYIGGRVEIDGELYGTLCFADRDTREEAFSEIQQTFVELLTRWVSYELERQRARSQLQRERDRLEEFAGVISHDLRNPLNIATGRLELLSREHDSEHIHAIEESLSRMEDLIEDVLTLARDGVQVETMTELDLAETARDAWSTVETPAAELVVVDNGRIRGDESRLRQLLENLFRNAIDHGGADVTVRVGLLANADGFYVADDGDGIPESRREQVFEAGYTTSDAGTGFGLRIVTDIATAHGWTVAAVEGTDGGARFEFEQVGVVDA
jgi:signal transduction histidine kinase